MPYEIAKRRQHPHQDAIHAAGWVSLFTLHVIWPFLWIWAMAFRPERGWGFSGAPAGIVIGFAGIMLSGLVMAICVQALLVTAREHR